MILENSQTEQQDSYVTNGFFILNPSVTYHISLFWLIISSFLLTLIAFHHIDQYEEIEVKNKSSIINNNINKLKKSIRIAKHEHEN
jgi:hypothetical protein